MNPTASPGADRHDPFPALYGELTIRTATTAKDTLLAALENSAGIVDLSQVTAMDGAGLQLLLLTCREAERRNTQLAFHSPSRAVRAGIALARVEHLLGLSTAETAR